MSFPRCLLQLVRRCSCSGGRIGFRPALSRADGIFRRRRTSHGRSLASHDEKDRHETGLRGWAERTRTRKCRFTQRLAELLGFPEHFGTRDFSCFPGAPLSVGRQKPA